MGLGYLSDRHVLTLCVAVVAVVGRWAFAGEPPAGPRTRLEPPEPDSPQDRCWPLG